MKYLASKLLARQREEEEKKSAIVEANKSDIAWGSQIRSYVFAPYTMVKDLRTGVETGNVAAVMDGDLDAFVNAYLMGSAALKDKRTTTIKTTIKGYRRPPGLQRGQTLCLSSVIGHSCRYLLKPKNGQECPCYG